MPRSYISKKNLPLNFCLQFTDQTCHLKCFSIFVPAFIYEHLVKFHIHTFCSFRFIFTLPHPLLDAIKLLERADAVNPILVGRSYVPQRIRGGKSIPLSEFSKKDVTKLIFFTASEFLDKDGKITSNFNVIKYLSKTIYPKISLQLFIALLKGFSNYFLLNNYSQLKYAQSIYLSWYV